MREGAVFPAGGQPAPDRGRERQADAGVRHLGSEGRDRGRLFGASNASNDRGGAEQVHALQPDEDCLRPSKSLSCW